MEEYTYRFEIEIKRTEEIKACQPCCFHSYFRNECDLSVCGEVDLCEINVKKEKPSTCPLKLISVRKVR